MKRGLLILSGAIVLAFAGQVAAQTCASPLPLVSNGTYTADTCTAGNPLPNMGGTPSAGNDVIYSFVASGASASISVNSSVSGATIYLLPSCTSSTNATAFGYVGTPLVINSANSPDGATMYINATYDGSLPPSTCGTITGAVTGTLPVKLQSFSVI